MASSIALLIRSSPKATLLFALSSFFLGLFLIIVYFTLIISNDSPDIIFFDFGSLFSLFGGILLIFYFLDRRDKRDIDPAAISMESANLSYQNEQAISLMKTGNYSEAINYFDELLKNKRGSDIDKTKIRSRRARCYFKLKDYDKAYDDIKAVIFFTKSATTVTDYIFRINCELKLGKNKIARKTLKIAQKRRPDDPKLRELEIRLR